jgi:hypothetical protein
MNSLQQLHEVRLRAAFADWAGGMRRLRHLRVRNGVASAARYPGGSQVKRNASVEVGQSAMYHATLLRRSFLHFLH